MNKFRMIAMLPLCYILLNVQDDCQLCVSVAADTLLKPSVFGPCWWCGQMKYRSPAETADKRCGLGLTAQTWFLTISAGKQSGHVCGLSNLIWYCLWQFTAVRWLHVFVSCGPHLDQPEPLYCLDWTDVSWLSIRLIGACLLGLQHPINLLSGDLQH